MQDSPQQYPMTQRAITFSIPQAAQLNDKYTVYALQMETQMKTWSVDRRYSEFRDLHIQLSKTKKYLPKFPPKKLNKLKDQVIESRKISLSNYMNELCSSFNIFDDKDIIEFIQMKDKEYMRQYFQNLYEYQDNLLKEQNYHRVSDVSDKSGHSDDNLGQMKSPVKTNPNLTQSFTGGLSKQQVMPECERRVIELLEELELRPEKFSNNLKSFEEYYFTNKPMLSSNYVKRLFFGDGYKINGLLQHLSCLDQQSISVVNVVNFIARLLDYRRNHQIEQFRQVFSQCEQVFIKKLNLEKHMSNPSCKEGALYIINEYLNLNLIQANRILNHPESVAQFEKWKKQKQVVQKSYMSSISPMRLKPQNIDSTKNSAQKSFNFEKNNLKKNNSFIGFQQDPKFGGNKTDDERIEDLQIETTSSNNDFERLKMIKQKSHNLAFRSQIGVNPNHDEPLTSSASKQQSQFKRQQDTPSDQNIVFNNQIDSASDSQEEEKEQDMPKIMIGSGSSGQFNQNSSGKIHKVSDDSNQVQISTGTSNNNFIPDNE
eukprot:403375693